MTTAVSVGYLLDGYKEDEDMTAALAAGEFEENLTIPSEKPYALDLRCRRLDYVVVTLAEGSFSIGDTGLLYSINYLDGVVTFDERLAGHAINVRYKLA